MPHFDKGAEFMAKEFVDQTESSESSIAVATEIEDTSEEEPMIIRPQRTRMRGREAAE